MEVTLSVFGTFVRFVDMGSTWVNLLCYPFVAYLVGGIINGIYNWTPNQFVTLCLSLVILAVSAWLARNTHSSQTTQQSSTLSDAENAKMLQEVEAQQADFGLQK